MKNTEDQRHWVHILGAALGGDVRPGPGSLGPAVPHSSRLGLPGSGGHFSRPSDTRAAPVSPLGVALAWWNQERAAVLWREGEARGAGPEG